MKEKRILCVEVSGECRCLMDVNRPSLAFLCGSSQGLYCTKNISWKPITKDACKNCKEGRYQGTTRKQIVYKIANAIFEKDNVLSLDISFEQLNKKNKKFYIELSEAILKSILEDNNASKN